MQKKFVVAISLLLVTFIVACAGGEDSYSLDAGEPAYYEESSAEIAYDVEKTAGSADTLRTSFESLQTQERLIIREGDMDVVVEDTDLSLAKIARLAERQGGWVVSSNVYDAGGAKSGTITVRVPVDQFEATMTAIREMATEVRSESTKRTALPGASMVFSMIEAGGNLYLTTRDGKVTCFRGR